MVNTDFSINILCCGSIDKASTFVKVKNCASKAAPLFLRKWPPRLLILYVLAKTIYWLQPTVRETYWGPVGGVWMIMWIDLQFLFGELGHCWSSFCQKLPKFLWVFGFLGELAGHANNGHWLNAKGCGSSTVCGRSIGVTIAVIGIMAIGRIAVSVFFLNCAAQAIVVYWGHSERPRRRIFQKIYSFLHWGVR